MDPVEAGYVRVFGDPRTNDGSNARLCVLRYYTLKMKSVMQYLDSLVEQRRRKDGVESLYAQIFATAMFAFMHPGTSCGDIISQCVASPLTQDFLDSTHHKAAVEDIDAVAATVPPSSSTSEEEDESSCDWSSDDDGEDSESSSVSSEMQLDVNDINNGMNPKQLVMAIFNGRKVDIKGTVYWKVVPKHQHQPLPPVNESIRLVRDGKIAHFSSPAVVFTNNTYPAFTHWYQKYGRDTVLPNSNHLNSILLLARTNRTLYTFLYSRVKGLFSEDVNRAYLSIFISVLCCRPRCITALNRSFIGRNRDRLSAACFENPRKLFVDGAIASSSNGGGEDKETEGDELFGWTPASFAFGFLPTHVGIAQPGYETSVVATL